MLTVNTNIASLTAQRNLSKSQGDLDQAIERLSSGLRINSAKDDAAGLFVSQQMTRDIDGSNQAERNANDGISLGQIAESALGSIATNLQRIRVLAVQGANSTTGTDGAAGLQKEVEQLSAEITRVAGSTKFNGTDLLGSGATGSLNFQVGSASGDHFSLALTNFASGLAGISTVSVSSVAGASAAISTIDGFLTSVNKKRAEFGAVQNRFEAVVSNLQVYSDNLSTARSRVQDADFAQETAKLTRAQILQQAGTSVLAQANSLPKTALTLLQG